MPADLIQVPYINREQILMVDRVMVEELHITLSQMMENAGHHLAKLARARFMDGCPLGKKVVILTGKGGNGGGAMVSARHLQNWGADVTVVLGVPRNDLTIGPAMQLHILQQIQVPILQAEEVDSLTEMDLIIDGLLGYGLTGSPQGLLADLISWANKQDVPVLSLDIPAGVDASTGEVHLPAVKATATMTLALPKEGLRAEQALDHVGELYLADIGVPPSVYEKPELQVKVGPLFAEDDVLRVR
ncbi:NAD(P)H-hydrate epimerase [Candidatus Neomarinimicrobiota bacterium]